ncbi:Rpn family recombination-promoting nuclease/putative transposase [Natroniella sp. ANB-PHB2]|uniref:Rpn family recombination-promoting nuclease/putative transposase n=1 Tax=Natroniella sp. ANB-PHB2 TaxID=3384444 RepID=UPI0038D3BFDA
MKREMPDLLWKEIIEDLFEDFLEFFMPKLYQKVDLSQGYEFLDNELANIVDKTMKGKKMVDRLVKVYLKDGRENWILVHLEVQGYYEAEFSARMFKYFYRIYDKYDQKIVALAIFTEGREGYKPNSFNYDFHGTKLNYDYNSYKVLEQQEEELLKSDNPFAMVILAGLYSLKSKGKNSLRYNFKQKLFRLLLDKGYDREKIYNIFEFLDGILFLPKSIELRFKNTIKQTVGGDEIMAKELTNLYQVGKSEGKSEGKLEMVENLLEVGVELDKIAAASGLSKKEIEKIKKKSQH